MQFCKSLGLFIFESAIYVASFCYLRETSCHHSLLLNDGYDSDVHSYKDAKEELEFVWNFVNPVFLCFQDSVSKDRYPVSPNHVKFLHSSLVFCLLSKLVVVRQRGIWHFKLCQKKKKNHVSSLEWSFSVLWLSFYDSLCPKCNPIYSIFLSLFLVKVDFSVAHLKMPWVWACAPQTSLFPHLWKVKPRGSSSRAAICVIPRCGTRAIFLWTKKLFGRTVPVICAQDVLCSVFRAMLTVHWSFVL